MKGGEAFFLFFCFFLLFPSETSLHFCCCVEHTCLAVSQSHGLVLALGVMDTLDCGFFPLHLPLFLQVVYLHLSVGVMDFSHLLLLSAFPVFSSFSKTNFSLALWLLDASYGSMNSFSAACLSFHKELRAHLG